MDSSGIGIMQMLKTSMGYTHERQDMLSRNIANVDTPGYKAREMKEVDFKRIMQAEARKLELRGSSIRHQQPLNASQTFRDEELDMPFESTPTENTVNLEEQMAKVAENEMMHQQAITLYEKMGKMFKIALGGGG